MKLFAIQSSHHRRTKISRYLPKNLLKVIERDIDRKLHFAHIENLIWSMIINKTDYLSVISFRIFIKARKLYLKEIQSGVFNHPKLISC